MFINFRFEDIYPVKGLSWDHAFLRCVTKIKKKKKKNCIPLLILFLIYNYVAVIIEVG